MNSFSTPSLPSVMRDFLEGTSARWEDISADKETFISKLLCPSVSDMNHKKLIELLKTLAPRQVCQYQFKTNDIVWICRECQKDETCVLCNECYIASDHEGHEVYFYHSAAGGCCDCGDSDAWSTAGFCNKHGKKHDDPVSFLPLEMKTRANQICNAVIDGFLRFCHNFCNLEAMSGSILDFEDYTITLYYDEFHSMDDFKKLLLSNALEVLLDGHPDEMSESQLAKQGSLRLKQNVPGNETRMIITHLIDQGYTVRAFSPFDYKRYDAVLSGLRWLHSTALACDGMCKIICSTLSSNRLSNVIDFDMYLDRSLGKSFHDLLLSLMADQSFKMTAAIAYTNSYRRICMDFNHGAGTAGSTMFNLSVQFLNREVFVHEICYHHAFIEEPCKVLYSILAVKPSNSNDFLQSPFIMKRRYSPILGDFKVICAIPDISRLFVTNCLPQWLDVLEHLQLIHWQKRELFAHVAYEDASTWMHAFNLSLGITALFDYLCNWFVHCSSAQTNVKESTSTTKDHSVRIPQIGVKDLLSAVLDRCIRWLEQNCSTEYLIACCNKVDATVFPRTLVTHEYSFHIPMHRFFAHIIFEASKHQHLVHCLESIFITLTHNDTASAVLLHHVLRPIVLNRQIKRNMWRRNGMNMYDQVMNYSEIPYSRVFRDLDFLLVQSCAVAVSTSTLLRYIFASFGVLEYSFPEEFVVEDHSLMDYVPDLISDTLHFIINLVTETPVEPRSHSSDRLRPLLRRELIQVLTSGPLTYSKLQESISTFYEADKLSSDIIDDIILGVGNKINPISLTAAPMYNLKKELWSEYDPCFPRLSDTMHSKALENRIKCTTNVAIVPPPLSAHPCFATLRAKILFDFHTLLVIRNFVYITASACTTKPIYLKLCDSWPFKSSDKLLSKLTQLLTLCIHEAKQQTDCDSFVQGVTAESRVHEQTGPSLMQGLVDIYNANQASVLGNEYYYLGWVIDQLLLLSPVCQAHYNFIMQSAGSKQDINQRNNMNELKVRSQQQAMSSIQQAAAQFLSMLDDISSSDEEDDMENKKQDAASENIDINEDNVDNSMDVESGRESTSGQDGPSPQPGYNSLQQDDADDVDQLDFGQDVFDQKTKRTRKNSEAFQECESEEVCIICQSDVNTQQEDFLGYLGLVQASTVLQPCQETTFTALPNKTKVDSSHILRKNCGDCNLRIGLCGHQMHQSCFNKYFASQQIKSVTQEFMIFDASQGFFYCPLCRKLCNFLLPNVQPLSVDPVTMPTDNEESTKPWLDRVAFVRNKVGNISWESPFIERGESASVDLLLRPSIHHRLASMLTDAMSNNFYNMHTVPVNRQEALQQFDAYVSCLAYTFGSELAEHHVPGFFLPEVQVIRSAYKSTVNPDYTFYEYSVGQDDLRFAGNLIRSVGQLCLLVDFDETFLSLLLTSLFNLPSFNLQLTEQENSIFWFDHDELPPLLTLPLADVFILVLGCSFQSYRLKDSEDLLDIVFELTPWICIARLVQLLIFEHSHNSNTSTTSTDDELASQSVCDSAFSNLFQFIRENILVDQVVTFDTLKPVLVQWVIFLRYVIHTITRLPEHRWKTRYLANLGDWIVQDITIETITEDIVCKHLEVLELDCLLSTFSDCTAVWQTITPLTTGWIRNLHNEVRLNELSPLLPSNTSSSHVAEVSLSKDATENGIPHPVSTIRGRFIGMVPSTMSQPYFPHLPRFKTYPTLTKPSLFKLPSEYSKLHAMVSSKSIHDLPVLCLRCGAILDGSGQGQCLVHSYDCGAGVGLFFTLQDCRVILAHGPRCGYFASPYVDVYGEIRHTVRGKPLKLDTARMEGLRSLWSRHTIPSEVFSIRSTATRVIINGYY